jgi:hypothetical protein
VENPPITPRTSSITSPTSPREVSVHRDTLVTPLSWVLVSVCILSLETTRYTKMDSRPTEILHEATEEFVRDFGRMGRGITLTTRCLAGLFVVSGLAGGVVLGRDYQAVQYPHPEASRTIADCTYLCDDLNRGGSTQNIRVDLMGILATPPPTAQGTSRARIYRVSYHQPTVLASNVTAANVTSAAPASPGPGAPLNTVQGAPPIPPPPTLVPTTSSLLGTLNDLLGSVLHLLVA